MMATQTKLDVAREELRAVSKAFGEYVRLALEWYEISVESCAERVSLSVDVLQAILDGEYLPDGYGRHRLMTMLDLTIDGDDLCCCEGLKELMTEQAGKAKG